MAKTFQDPLRTLGAPEDPVATDTSSAWSAMSLLKAIYANSVALVTATSTTILANKTIDAALNTISNLTTAVFAANVVDTDTALAANSTSRLPTQSAVKGYVDAAVSGLLNGVSASFDTLAELATGLGTKLTAASNLSDVADAATAFGNIKQAATQSATGVAEQATDAEVQAGADTDRYITPAGLSARTATEARTGIAELATAAETLAGGDAARVPHLTGLHSALAQLMYGHLSGLTLSNNGTDATNDIDIAVGTATAADQSAILRLASGLTKQLDAAWAVGTNQGGLDTGAIADTTYHVWLIRRSDTGVVDVLFSTSASSPTMPANYDQKRRIGSIIRASGAILAFVQDGDYFRLKASVQNAAANNPGTAAVSLALTVPAGVNVQAIVNVHVLSSTAASMIQLSDLDANDEAPSGTVAPQSWAGANSSQDGRTPGMVRTNTSAQVRYRVSFSDANVTVYIVTLGWWDRRGR